MAVVPVIRRVTVGAEVQRVGPTTTERCGTLVDYQRLADVVELVARRSRRCVAGERFVPHVIHEIICRFTARNRSGRQNLYRRGGRVEVIERAHGGIGILSQLPERSRAHMAGGRLIPNGIRDGCRRRHGHVSYEFGCAGARRTARIQQLDRIGSFIEVAAARYKSIEVRRHGCSRIGQQFTGGVRCSMPRHQLIPDEIDIG